MAGYGEALERLRSLSGNPAAPSGLSQGAAREAEEVSGYDASRLQQWAPTRYADQAQDWYTGANPTSTQSGWSTEFVEKYVSGWNAALESKSARTYYESPNATGVVLYDHESEDGKTRFRFGDVYEDGEFKGNVYDQADEDTANLMMLPWISDGTAQRRLFEDPEASRQRIAERVAQVREENNKHMGKALGAMEFAEDTADTAEGIRDSLGGAGDDLLAGGGGLLGGAVTGAAVGSVLPGVGTAVGGVVGGLVGGLGGWLNRDEVTEAAARSYEISRLSFEEHGVRGVPTALRQAAEMSMRFTSPLSNLTKGSADALLGETGDGVSERYAVDDSGESTAPLWLKIADLGATASDSLLQFISPFNRMVYTAQMSSAIGGRVGELGLTGSQFDPSEGGFDNIFLDDDGNLDPVSAAAGIAATGIDAVQLLGRRSLASTSDRAGAAARAGRTPDELAGMRFTFDAAGGVTGHRRSIALFAPSEQVAYWSAQRSARVKAMSEFRAGKRSTAAVTSDDLYFAARELSMGSNKLKTMMVNAIGEGYEEAAQAFFEPISVDSELSGSEIFEAGLFGGAAGAGMSLGATFRAPGRDAKQMAQAYLAETFRTGVEPDLQDFTKRWESMTAAEKRVATAAFDNPSAELTRKALDLALRDQSATLVAGPAGEAKAVDALRAEWDKELKAGTRRTDQFTVMSGRLDATSAPAEAIEAAAGTVLRLLENRAEGYQIQIATLKRELAELAEGAEGRAELEATLAHLQLGSAWGEQFLEDLRDATQRLYAEDIDAADADALVDQLNEMLGQVFHRRAPVAPPPGFEQVDEQQLRNAAAQFVTLTSSREPKLDSGSYLTLRPYVSRSLTRERAEGLVQVNTDVLQAINGDFDGDQLRAENQLIIGWDRFELMRAGMNFAGAGREIDMATRQWEGALTRVLGEAVLAEEAQGIPADVGEAQGVLTNIGMLVRARYGNAMSAAALSRVLDAFNTAVRAGDPDARMVLLNTLAREAGEAVTNIGRELLRDEWLNLANAVSAQMQRFHAEWNRQRTASMPGPSPTVPTEDIDTPEGKNRRKQRATTDAQTLTLFAPGTTLFRMFQQIHYSVYNAPVLSAANTEPMDVQSQIEFYAMLGRDVTESELDRAAAGDPVLSRAMAMLARLVDSAMSDPETTFANPAQAMVLIAATKVREVEYRDGAAFDTGRDLSTAQLLLKMALQQDREARAVRYEVDEKLQARYNQLMAMTIPNDGSSTHAERALVELFKSVQFGEMLGDAVGHFAAHTTPEQWLQVYAKQDRNDQVDRERFFKNAPEYLDRPEGSTNPPYSFAEIKDRKVSGYRALLDAMMAVGRAELSFDPSKPASEALSGRKAKVSQEATETLRTAHQMVRDAFASYRKVIATRKGPRRSELELVQEMLESDPSVARDVLNLIPDAAANALFEYKNDRLYMSPWLYEMFTIKDPDEAVFHYWKNLTLMKWASVQERLARDNEAGKDSYYGLQSRMQRLMYRLAQEPGEVGLELLMRRFASAKNLDEFFHWLNSTPGIRGQEPPYLPFMDDVVDFDSEAGGWAPVREGADLRDAIVRLRSSTEQLSQEMARRAASAATDTLIRQGLRRALNNDPEATGEDHENLRKFRRAVQLSHELPRGIAPSVMLQLTQGALRGFDAQSHDKGRTATTYGPMGEFQALMDAFGFFPGLERAMEVVTAHSIGSLGTNVGDLARTDGTAMDAHGRQIEWEQLTVEQALDMLEDDRTAPLAYALLTPTMMDATPTGLTERLLTEANLKSLLDDNHFKDLFAERKDRQLDQAMRYLSLVNARAQEQGGKFDVIRLANKLAIARTSSLDHVATEQDLIRLRNQAYIDLARVLKLLGQIQATPRTRAAGTLRALRTGALRRLHEHRKARSLPDLVDTTTGEVMTQTVESIASMLEAERDARLADLVDRFEGEELDNRRQSVVDFYAANTQRMRDLLSDDVLAATINRFELTGDPQRDPVAQQQITTFVRARTGFGNQVPEAALAALKLNGQLDEGLDPDLTADEWGTLSRAVMQVYIVEQSLRVSTHSRLPGFPKGDPATSDARFFSLFDPSYSFLVTELIDADAPMVKAAEWLHMLAERPRVEMSIDDMVREVNAVLRPDELGPLTPGITAQMIQAEERMDSAAAGQAVAGAGNGPKRQALLAYATRRDGAVPDASLLTTAQFSGALLAEGASLNAEFAVQPAGVATPTTMPVAQLENRFFSAIRFNGEEIPLDAENLGFAWDGAAEDNPYRYVSLQRLRPVLERYAADNQLDLSGVTVEVQFFHPDSQPVDMWNNAFFEGMNHSLLPDVNESLIAGLWADNGGMISKATQAALDAGKLGLRAVQPFQRQQLTSGLAAAEALWYQHNNFAGMLRAKTRLLMEYDDGTGALDPSYYNAIYKHMKLAHLLVGRTADGDVVAWTAEQAIAHFAQDPNAELPFSDAKLVKLSADVLRTMIGDAGTQGVKRFFDLDLEVNPDSVPRYQGLTQEMLSRFGAGWAMPAGTPGDTQLANIGRQRVLTVRTMLTEKEQSQRAERRRFLAQRSADVRAARQGKLDMDATRMSFRALLQAAKDSVSTERAGFDFMASNSGVVGPRGILEVDHSERLIEMYAGVQDQTRYQRGWAVVDEGTADYPGGVLTLEALHGKRAPEHQVVQGDLALVRLDTFNRGEETEESQAKVEKALNYLAANGATIVLGSGNGRGDLRFFGAQYLQEELGYVPVAGSRHMFEPVEFSTTTQNERAYESTLTETRRFTPAKNAITFQALEPFGPSAASTDENVAVLNPASRKLRDRKLVNNLLPSALYQGYNVPFDDGTDTGLYARALAHLKYRLNDPDTRKALEKAAGKPKMRGEMPLTVALDRFLAKITERGSLTPMAGDEIEVGDIIPFIHRNGTIVLYRHGYKLPDVQKRNEMFAASEGANIAVSLSEIDSDLTSNTGTIREVENRTGYGRNFQLEIPLQPYGDKIQLELNGMKYVVVPPPEGFELPLLFRNGTVVDLLSDYKSSSSKEAFHGRVNHYRTALAMFQYDFTADLTRFFFPDSQPGDADAEQSTLELLRRLERQQDVEIPLTDADLISKARAEIATDLAPFAAAMQDERGVPTDWLDRIYSTESPEAAIARAVILYLLTPGAQLDNVIRSAGFSHPNAHSEAVQTREVPGLFADLLDNGMDSPLHEELISRFDGQLYRGPNGEGYRLRKDWLVEMYDASGQSTLGFLQYGEAHSSGDNPVTDMEAFTLLEKQAVSAHNALAASMALNVTTAHEELKKARAFAAGFAPGGPVPSLAELSDVWPMLTEQAQAASSAKWWKVETAAESLRRAAAREEIVGFFQPLNTDEWSEQDQIQYRNEAVRLLERLGLSHQQLGFVDTWVRQHLGRPHGMDADGNELGLIGPGPARQVLAQMHGLVSDDLLPLAGANVPLMDVNQLTTLYLANLNRSESRRWAPREYLEENSPKAETWDAWVDVAFGTAYKEDMEFDQLYLLAVDGFMHGYQGATDSTRELPVSSDLLVSRQLMDPETGRKLNSISADENTRVTDRALFDATEAELESIVLGVRIYAPGRSGPDPNSAMGQQKKRVERWRKEADAPTPQNKTMRGVRKSGQTFLGHTTTTNAFFRSMINLRAGNTMFNPVLTTVAPVEAYVRRTINQLSNLSTGEALGATGRFSTRVLERFGNTSWGEFAQQLGFETVLTSEQHQQIAELIKALATRSEFKSTVYKELSFQYPTIPGIGPVEKLFEKYAKLGARMQDPAWQMPPRVLARTYLTSVIKTMTQKSSSAVSIERLIAGLAADPEWVLKNDLEAHNAAIAAIAQERSLKVTPLSLAVRGIVDPLSESEHFGRNAAGNILKVLTLFQNFWANFGTTITGLQGASDWVAYFLDGRQHPKMLSRLQAGLRGEAWNPDAEAEFFDMSEVLESLDLADSFIRGGVTHTALFTLGMFAGGLGLGGEDEEEKFRRRQAELQGVPMLYDPRDLENDFRNKDAIYLDWLPFGLDSLFRDPETGQAMLQMNWVARTLMSPILGFERFYRTGDFSEVIYGFKDAVGSHPIVNQQLWDEAVRTASMLHAEASEAAENGDAPAASNPLVTAVSVLESMLLENSFLNLIYVGLDDWDRDPYVLPLRDSDGELQRDIENQVRPNDTALRPFYDEESGEIGYGYLGRTDAQAQRRVLTENRGTMAFVASLFTGGIGESDYWRYNMPVKTRTLDKPEISQEEAEALLKAAAAWQLEQVDQPMVTPEELLPSVRQAMYDLGDRTGQFFTDDQIWAEARRQAARAGELALSVHDDELGEVLTTSGARAVFEGLRTGAVKFGDAALGGLFIPMEMREQISADWSEELVEEGLRLGLTETKARSRMQRIMQGPLDDPEVSGLGDLLWSNKISYSPTQTYAQLNTTYVMGPNGRPMATGFKRDGLLGAAGLLPFRRQHAPQGATTLDSRGNVVDLAAGLNTGLRAVVPMDDSRYIPTDAEIAESITKAIEKAKAKTYQPFEQFSKSGSGGSGWRNFGRRSGWSSGGGGGWSSSGGGAYFVRMNPLPRGTTTYANTMSNINTTNPIIRRATVRRERVWSDRGRLKQWQ